MSSPQSKARVIGLMRPLKDATVTAGETATFECELSYEGIAVEWFLGGTKLEPSDRVSPHTGFISSNLLMFCMSPDVSCCFVVQIQEPVVLLHLYRVQSSVFI